MGLNANKLVRLIETHGAANISTVVREGLEAKKFSTRSFVLADLTEAFFGRDYLTKERALRAIQLGRSHLLEAGEAVSASAFADITGQLLVTEIKDKYQAAEFVGDRLCRNIPNPGGNLKTHIVPYLSDVLDLPDALSEGQDYPQSEFAESYVTLTQPVKRGLICAITMEMMISDLTGQAQDSAGSVGRSVGYDREERILNVVLGLTNNYSWNGNSINTYLATSGTGNYVNKLLNTTITTYDHVNQMEQLAAQMADPITGRLINVAYKQILCMPEKRYQLKRILNATEVRDASPGYATSGDPVQTVSANPLDTQYELITSKIARALTQANTSSTSVTKERVYYGDFARAFYYREVFPFRTEQAPPMNPDEFRRDIVLQVKCGEFGVAGVYDPRYAGFSTSEAS